MKKFIATGVLILCIASCSSPYSKDETVSSASSAITVCPKNGTLEGVDVSGYQPNTDWAAVKQSGRTFAFIKATEGTGYTDHEFVNNWQGAKAGGILRGAYHYFWASLDPTEAADFFVHTIGPLGEGDLPPVLDLEETKGQPVDVVLQHTKQWLERVEQATGRKPIIYTYISFWDHTLGHPSGFDQYPLWIANWQTNCPFLPGSWANWPFWQYSDKGTVTGIKGVVDLDRFNGSLDDLMAFASASTTAPPPATMPPPPMHTETPQDAWEALTCEAATGWAYNPGTLDTPLRIDFYSDGPIETGVFIGSAVADQHRDDLCSSINSCDHGFSFSIPDSLHNGQEHSVYAYSINPNNDPFLLPNSPNSIRCSSGNGISNATPPAPADTGLGAAGSAPSTLPSDTDSQAIVGSTRGQVPHHRTPTSTEASTLNASDSSTDSHQGCSYPVSNPTPHRRTPTGLLLFGLVSLAALQHRRSR